MISDFWYPNPLKRKINLIGIRGCEVKGPAIGILTDRLLKMAFRNFPDTNMLWILYLDEQCLFLLQGNISKYPVSYWLVCYFSNPITGDARRSIRFSNSFLIVSL